MTFHASLTKQFMRKLSNGILGTLAFLESWRSPIHVPSAPALNLLVGGEESTAQSQPVLQVAVGGEPAPQISEPQLSWPAVLPISLHLSFEKCG